MATSAQKKLVQKRLADIREANNIWFRRHKWTGFSGKTVWDWLQLLGVLAIPVVLAFASLVFSAQQSQTNNAIAISQNQVNNTIAINQQDEVVLETYLDRMSDLLINNKLGNSKPGDPTRVVARARTLEALRQLDPIRKGLLLQFLHEAHLINENQVVVDLSGADLTNADLAYTNLSGADLSDTNLRGANLYDAILDGVDLSGSLLGRSRLTLADLHSANLRGTELSGANLQGAKITSGQLVQARSLKGAIMPDGSKHP